MNDEYKKLDQLMQKNIPDAHAPLKILSLPKTNSNWIKGFALTTSLLLVFFVNQNRRQINEAEGLMTLVEVLSWDMTTDEPNSEIDYAMALVE